MIDDPDGVAGLGLPRQKAAKTSLISDRARSTSATRDRSRAPKIFRIPRTTITTLARPVTTSDGRLVEVLHAGPIKGQTGGALWNAFLVIASGRNAQGRWIRTSSSRRNKHLQRHLARRAAGDVVGDPRCAELRPLPAFRPKIPARRGSPASSTRSARASTGTRPRDRRRLGRLGRLLRSRSSRRCVRQSRRPRLSRPDARRVALRAAR